MVCLDTDIIVALLRGDERALEVVDRLQKSGGVLKTTVITAYELIKGASISAMKYDNTRLVMELLHSITLLPLDLEACRMAGLIYAHLREEGKMIGEFDILIAGIVKHNKEVLVTRDRHFQDIPDLSIKIW